ncbi:DUF3558 domain-containing protein [Actinokineospora sp.]|uniref:DUF3558 domain-containing protein n=1 Tax=Actinokineospora sp. TaxID=1872133 RepID=UPI004037F2AA
MLFASAGLVGAAGAGCGQQVAGQPSSAATTHSASSTAPTTAPSSSQTTSGTREWSGPQMCDLVTAAEAQQLGGSPAGRASFSTATADPQCSWSKDTVLILDYGKGFQSKNAKTGAGITLTPMSVAGLSAVQSLKKSSITLCQVIVDISDSSTMSFAVSVHDSGEGKYEPCDVATRLANIVIPKIKG